MSKKRKKTLKAPSKLTLTEIRKLTPSELSKYTRKQLRIIERKVVKSQNEKIERIKKDGFGLIGRIRDYVNEKGKISSSTTRTKKDILIGRIMAVNQLETDSHTSVKTIAKAYKKYHKGNQRYGPLTKEQHVDIANLWYDYRNNRLSYKISSEMVYELIQIYLSEDRPIDFSEIITELIEKKQQQKEILEAEEKTVRKSRIPDPYLPDDL